ncbi:hypothetical protein J421_1463 [Gemmatirosa kalamazoonensis]|uniref:Membrane associated hydrolase n=1 Tax=Gemmatirosa kalamazoonensis TaxID=861299 RepID=W0RF83_9BACT|nr:DUF5916 domain-containing protein [Gemmatirosa kalamazoonensis]AHG89000.1 hypothetical protein J421_1463 [Gemmatirosa kalamazoonensis]
MSIDAKKLAFAGSILLTTLGRGGAAGAQVGDSAREAAPVRSPARAVRAERAERAPVIDGDDRDAVWRAAMPLGAFRVFDPTEDGEPTLRTEARLAFDARHVYVFVRAFDPHPDSIVSRLSRRDVRTPSDQIKVMLDSYHDRRTAYEFAVNPAGVKRDYYAYDDGVEDVTWDAVWDVATRVDSLGWTAEFRIPLSQLRFPRAGAHTFGVMVTRDVARTNERYSWPVYRRSRPGLPSQFADVAGFEGLGASGRLEAMPHVVATNRSATRPDGFARTQRQDLGADLKVGLGSNLTLDATVNPDFGQVEADPATVNLTAFETFFDERRPFFQEGTGIFSFGADATRLFYSRRIGRAPQLAALAPTDADVPGATTILGAGKLTGRVGNGLSVGALGAATGRERAGGATVEPAAAYSAARVQQDLRGGESGIGAMFTGVRRSLDAADAPYLRDEAYAGGVDLRHRFAGPFGGRYRLAASLAGSVVRGSAQSIARTQRSAVHYYQRPDAGLTYDSTRTALGGTALDLSASEVAGTWRFDASYSRLSAGFETNDLGFLSRADMQTASAGVRAVSSRPRAFWRNANASFDVVTQYTARGTPIASTVELAGYAQFASGAYLSADLWTDNAGAVYCDRCARGGPALRLSPATSLLINVSRDDRKRVVPYFAAIYTVGDGGRSTLWRVRPLVTLRPASNVNAQIGARYQRNRDATQWYANVTSGGTPRWLFARLDQHLLSFLGTLDVTATPTLSLQLYAEPFVSAGKYDDVRTLADPRARRYDDRFTPFPRTTEGFNSKQFNSTAVLRWEYRPGSTLFVVWSQGREQLDRDPGSFEAARDYRNLFGARPDNTLAVKLAYWIGR